MLDDLENWPAKVRLMQENWIGKSRGLEMTFPLSVPQDGYDGVTVYTTRPDTLVGASFIGLAPNHPLSQSLALAKQRLSRPSVMTAKRWTQPKPLWKKLRRRALILGSLSKIP